MTKPTKFHVRPEKAQISLGIHPVWSLCAFWVAKNPWFLPADSDDNGQTGLMPRLILVVTWRLGYFVGFVMFRLKLDYVFLRKEEGRQ